MVNAFYDKVRANKVLGPIFNEHIDDWSKHLKKMYAFWETLLFQKITYRGKPFPPHAKLAIGLEHFNTWVALFIETVDSHFIGKTAELAKARAINIANVFHHKIHHIKS